MYSSYVTATCFFVSQFCGREFFLVLVDEGRPRTVGVLDVDN